MKFKIGDRVKINDPDNRLNIPWTLIGIVVSINEYGNYHVKCDNDLDKEKTHCYCEGDLILIHKVFDLKDKKEVILI